MTRKNGLTSWLNVVLFGAGMMVGATLWIANIDKKADAAITAGNMVVEELREIRKEIKEMGKYLVPQP